MFDNKKINIFIEYLYDTYAIDVEDKYIDKIISFDYFGVIPLSKLETEWLMAWKLIKCGYIYLGHGIFCSYFYPHNKGTLEQCYDLIFSVFTER